MRKGKYLLLMLFTAQMAVAQQELKVTMPVENATVYLSGAQLFHSKSVSLPKGQTDVIVEGVSNNLDASSLQAGGAGNFTILDVQYRLYYPEPVGGTELPDAIQKKINKLNDSIMDLDYTTQAINNRKEVLNVQRNLLYNNKLLKPDNANDSLELIRNTIEYYNQKLSEIATEQLDLDKRIHALQKERSEMLVRLNELNNYWAQENAKRSNAPVPQVIISLITEAAGSATLDLNYLSYSAGWYATYDIKATDIGQPVRMTYKANVWQNSGIDWKDVLLTFSTGNPTIGNNPPQLTTWYLTYYNYYYNEKKAMDRADDVELDMVTPSMAEDLYLGNTSVSTGYANAGQAYDHTSQQQTLTNTEFEVKLKYSIPNDGKSHLVALQDKSLKADFNYLIVPKLDNDAFLIARITGWEDGGLMPGVANVYYKNSLVGKTSLNTLTLNDTLSVSMGRDKGIDVERKVLKEKSSDKLIGSDRRVERMYEITVRNSKAIGIEIVVMDQIPISNDQTIKVEVGEYGKGELDEYTGFITWRDKLGSKKTGTYKFGYTVTYPKDRPLQL
ncbi:MAG: DUF4139 domain-containing protein [Chitinophagales bacterium]|nr:DUF4139 domain-containing protein [Chitinophagales bacterium]